MAGRAELEKQALKGLASSWEECKLTRRRLLLDRFLLKWPKPAVIGVPTYSSASLNYNTLDPLFRLWAANTAAPKSPKVKKVWELVGQKSTQGEIQCDSWGLRKFLSFFIKRLAQTTKPRDPNNRKLKKILLEAWYPDRVAELDSDDEEDPMDEDDDGLLGLGDDLVPFVNGRLDDEDEPCDEEVSGPASPEVSGHPGDARAENEDSNAEQPTLEVSGHADNAGAEKDSSAEPPTLQVSGHMSGNNPVLDSTAAASVQPELIVCSDDEEVPRRPVPTPARAVTRQEHLNQLKQRLLQLKQQKRDIQAKTSFRHDCGPHHDPSRVETQLYDVDAAARSWQEADGEPAPVDLEGEATGSCDDSEAAEDSAVAEEPQATMDSATKVVEEPGATTDSVVEDSEEATKDSTDSAKGNNK
ncbi:unnamed protein product [Symbiodinium sp. CCMP2592]|nr:unnamed protein product [Symbiodinium sp. CCMP2592]